MAAPGSAPRSPPRSWRQARRVAIAGRRRERLEQALAGHPEAKTAAITADGSDPAELRRLVADVIERFGRLDVVVSNAAAYESSPLEELDDAA